MAKKEQQPLNFTDIVLRAEADVIQQAYEARVKIDELLAERSKAYEQIAALEEQVDSVLGEPGVFPFPAPPMPVAGFGAKAPPAARAKPKRAANQENTASAGGGSRPATSSGVENPAPEVKKPAADASEEPGTER